MSATQTATGRRAATSVSWLANRWVRLTVFGVGLLLVMSIVRVVTGAGELISSGTVGAAVGLAVPIGLAGLGGLWSERSGVVNIGLEGMMILGTWGAGWAGSQWNPWFGVLAAVALGAFGGLIHAVATITFGVDQIVSGVALNILGLGVTQYLSAIAFTGKEGGGPTQSPEINTMGTLTLPGFSSLMGSIENHHWFLVSDLAAVLKGVTYQVSYLTIIAVLLLPLTYWILWRTAFGLRLRSCGEAPYAAETLGVNVYKYKYVAVVTSGALAGFGGAFLAIVASGIYREGQTAGRGYIGLAAMIFGNWRPGGLAAGALLFGYTDAMQLRSATAVHALLLLAAVLLALLAVMYGFRRKVISATAMTALAAVILAWFLATSDLPQQVTYMTPYITTLLVLSLASQRLRMPAADGLVYRRGEGG